MKQYFILLPLFLISCGSATVDDIIESGIPTDGIPADGIPGDGIPNDGIACEPDTVVEVLPDLMNVDLRCRRQRDVYICIGDVDGEDRDARLTIKRSGWTYKIKGQITAP